MPCSSGRPGNSCSARRTATSGPSTSGLCWSWRWPSATCRRAAAIPAALRCVWPVSSVTGTTRPRRMRTVWTRSAESTPHKAAPRLPSAAQRVDLGLHAMTTESCDVVVIGGGPAGSTAAALLARGGHQVILLEKAHHPRFHIGESLLPMNLPVFERLGVLEKVRALGVVKPGADFEADNERGYNSFAFCRAIGDSPPHAFQVWRADFDRMLFEHARSCGASARE